MNNYRLLVVEDSENLGLLYKQELEDDGYYVDLINSVSEATIQLNRHHYDLVILEIALFKKEGYDPSIKFEQISSKVPVVINTTDQLFQNKQNLNSDPYIAKSSDISVLKKKIKHLLENIRKTNINKQF